MFIEVKNAQKENILLNTDRIEYVLQQQDKDVFIRLASGEQFKLSDAEYQRLVEHTNAVLQ